MLPLLPPAVRIVADDGEPANPWRGYKLCLSGIPETGHVAVLQDDTVPCRNFAAALELIAEANPDVPVSLFLSKVPRRTHNLSLLRSGRSRYVDTHLQDLVHVVAILWPVHKAREFLSWIEHNPKRIRAGGISTSDDAHLTRWMELTRQTIRCTIPSIVQHPDDSSLVNPLKVSFGRDSGRTAATWIGDADPLELDWSR